MISGFKKFLFVVFLIQVASCAKDEVSPLDRYHTLKAYDQVSTILDDVLLEENSALGLAASLDDLVKIDGVASVEKLARGIMVTFDDGTEAVWLDKPDAYIPPFAGLVGASGSDIQSIGQITGAKTRNDDLIGNGRICILNQQYTDESRIFHRQLFENIRINGEAAGFSVDIINGSEVTPEFLKSKIADYGFVFFNHHGGSSSKGDIWCTGKEMTFVDFLKIDLGSTKYTISKIRETRNGVEKIVSYISVKSGFFKKEFAQNDLSKIGWYSVACEGMRKGDIANELVSKGSKVVVGWDEVNCVGQSTGEIFMSYLIGGETIGNAFELLPTDARIDNCTKRDAHLVYYPLTSKDAKLIDKEHQVSIDLTAPMDLSSTANRTVAVKGKVSGLDTRTHSFIEVNGVASTLELDANFRFEEIVVVDSGWNEIRVVVTGSDDEQSPIVASKSVSVFADIQPIPLWIQLSWNRPHSDVDIHLLKPGCEAPYTSCWASSSDCYWDNKVTYWGAYLDVDDRDGYGPEHITIPGAYQPGIYTLIVHYYEDDGGGPIDAFVKIKTLGDYLSTSKVRISSASTNGVAGTYKVLAKIKLPEGEILDLRDDGSYSRLSDVELIKK